MDELAEKAVSDRQVHSALIQLFSRIQEDILHSSLHPSELFGNRDMLREISELHEPVQAAAWLMDGVVTPYLAKLEGRKNRQQKQVAERVIAMIHEQYMADLSLESCADALGMNSYTLSKAFKQVTGVNFIDYVTRIRIEKAKELLVNTNKKFMMCQKKSAIATIISTGFLKSRSACRRESSGKCIRKRRERRGHVMEKPIQVFLAGDSTVSDCPPHEAPMAGWGQVFGQLFTEQVKVRNHAKGERAPTLLWRKEGFRRLLSA